jgi:uncharacterized membrane protein
MYRKLALMALLAAGFSSVASAKGHAGVEVCNESGSIHQLAIGYHDRKASDWASVGWLTLKPGKCRKVLNSTNGRDLYVTSRYYMDVGKRTQNDGLNFMKFLMAVGTMGEIKGKYMFCMKHEAFSIAGTSKCRGRGYGRAGFARVPTGGHRSVLLELLDNGRVLLSPAG